MTTKTEKKTVKRKPTMRAGKEAVEGKEEGLSQKEGMTEQLAQMEANKGAPVIVGYVLERNGRYAARHEDGWYWSKAYAQAVVMQTPDEFHDKLVWTQGGGTILPVVIDRGEWAEERRLHHQWRDDYHRMNLELIDVEEARPKEERRPGFSSSP